MFDESGIDVYVSRIREQVEVQENQQQIEAEERRTEFYAAIEQVWEHWFEVEGGRRNGIIGIEALDDITHRIRTVAKHHVLE